MICPTCQSDDGFEKRGETRVYISLTVDFVEDGWDTGDPWNMTIDTDRMGNEIIYCLACDSELEEDEIREFNAALEAVKPPT